MYECAALVRGGRLAAERGGLMDEELAELVEGIRACRLCRDAPANPARPLPHEPRPVVTASSTARILIAGQAPGTRVHATGQPFNDRSGDRLRDWLGVTREEFYDSENFAIVPMGFCFPGQDAKGSDLPPRRECAPTWRSELIAAMPQIELVLAIGLYAQGWHLGDARRASLTETVADWRAIFMRNETPRVLPLPHPSWRNTAWLKRNPWFETDLLPVLRREIAMRLGRQA
jgi:uracil-DNA glycosylase